MRHPTAPAARLLLVDPDPLLRQYTAASLRLVGHDVDESGDADDIERARHDGYQLVLMDPQARASRGTRHGHDAWQRLRALRDQCPRLPVIVMQRGADAADRTVALELGADAVVDKPVEPRLLQARVQALLRRQRENAEARALPFGPWRLDPNQRCLVLPDGRSVSLSPAEARLLASFLAHPQHPLSRERLLTLARGDGVEQLDRSIDTLVARLRHKLGPAPEGPIRTVRGVGYLFDALGASALGPRSCQGGHTPGTEA